MGSEVTKHRSVPATRAFAAIDQCKQRNHKSCERVAAFDLKPEQVQELQSPKFLVNLNVLVLECPWVNIESA